MRLWTFKHHNLYIYRVVDNSHFPRHGAEEEVAVVHVNIADGILVGIDALVESVLVVEFALLDVEATLQNVGSIFFVANPSDVAEVILTTLIQFNVNTHKFFVDAIYRIADDAGVAVALLVVLLDEGLLVFFKFGAHKFRRLKHAVPTLLLGVFQALAYFGVCECAVAVGGYVADFYLLALVDIDDEVGDILKVGVGYFQGAYLHIVISLFIIMFRDYVARL